MFPKRTFPVLAALVLAGAARAATTAELAAAEAGIPDSQDYSARPMDAHSPTNEELQAVEVENPNSIDSARAAARPMTPDEAWQAAESGNPDFR